MAKITSISDWVIEYIAEIIIQWAIVFIIFWLKYFFGEGLTNTISNAINIIFAIDSLFTFISGFIYLYNKFIKTSYNNKR